MTSTIRRRGMLGLETKYYGNMCVRVRSIFVRICVLPEVLANKTFKMKKSPICGSHRPYNGFSTWRQKHPICIQIRPRDRETEFRF